MYNITILLVEDENRIREIVKKYLEHEGLQVIEAADGKSAALEFAKREFHLLILDVMLPDTDGWTILRKIRETSKVPVIMLTARSEEEDKLFGFELGADDYITKPFSNKLLLARIKAVLKRNQVASINEEIIIKDLKINRDFRQVYVLEENVDLTPIEYSLLLYLIDNINLALSRTQILDAVWGYDYYGDERTVDTHVKRLRQKLETAGEYIQTIRGHGYRMVDNEK